MAVHIDDRDWSVLTLGERIRQVEVEGYVVIPGLLSCEHIENLRAETHKLEITPVDYSVHQRGHGHLERKKAYEAAGAMDRLYVERFDDGHIFSGKVASDVLQAWWQR